MNGQIRKRKSYFNLSSDQKARNKKKIEQALLEVNMLLFSMGLTFGKEIEIRPICESNADISRAEDISFEIKKMSELVFTKEEEFKRFFRFKDENNISDRLWEKLKSCLFPHMPSLYKIKKLREQMNSRFQFYQNTKGFFLNVKEKLTFILSQIIDKLEIDTHEILKLKFCGDGTNIGKNIKIFNFGFSCINDQKYCKTSKGHYILGVFEISNENYEELKACLSELFNELKDIEEIEIKQKIYKLEKILGGDLKFLGIVMGLNAANSNYPCIWCKIHKKEFSNLELDGSFKGKNARNLSEVKEHVKNKKSDLKKGYANEPIAIGFQFEKLALDMLHLFLRITDVLEQNLVIKLKTLDAANNSRSDDNLENQPMLKRFIDYITNDLHINRLYYVSDKQIVLRSLDGDEKFKLFENINIKSLFQDTRLEKAIEISRLWSEFYNIYMCVKNELYSPEMIKKETINWLSLYVSIYGPDSITPYIHIFACHLREFTLVFENINDFNQQGFEKQNDQLTKDFQRSTNKSSETYLKQLIQKRNRVEALSFDSFAN